MVSDLPITRPITRPGVDPYSATHKPPLPGTDYATWTDRGLTIERDYDASAPEFRGDKEQLIQAVLNIVHNAAQALSERIAREDATIKLQTRAVRQVTIAKQRHRLALELHVVDNGPGIPEEIKDRLFSPLVSGRDGGSGLGLNLAQTFVQQHKGLIECDSEPGRTDFKLMIPL